MQNYPLDVSAETDAASTETTSSANYFGIYHQPRLEGRQLPPPGHPLQLSVQLYNTKNTSIPLRVIANIDGRLTELVPTRVFLNRDDYPEYIIDLHAPLTFLEYYFIAYGDSGFTTQSDKFAFRRHCTPDIKPINTEFTSDIRDGSARLTEVVHKSRILERENKAHEHLQNIIQSINNELTRLDAKR